MSASGGSHQDFELNLASIIDCFTVLITYLLISASFISLGGLSVTVAAVSDEPALDPTLPQVNLSIMLQKDQSVTLQTQSDLPENNSTMNIPAKGDQKDTSTLLVQLNEIKQRYNLTSTLLGADDQILYQDMVAMVSAVQSVIPNIALSAEGIL
jgi:biopolymer transport protein ExbD